MNIWYISKYAVPPKYGKVGTRGFYLLQEFNRLGCDARLITSDSNHLIEPPKFVQAVTEETVDGVETYWLRTRKYDSARSFGRILSWFDFEWRLWRIPKGLLPKPDVIIISSLSLLTILQGVLMKKRFGCKLVFEIRDIWPLTLVTAGNLNAKHPAVLFLNWVERFGYKNSDLIVGTMPNLKEHVWETLGFEKEVVCVPQGFDPKTLSSVEPLPENYAETHIPRDKFVICHAGTIGADNALETFLECANSMSGHDDIVFLLVGDGYLKEKFKERYGGLPNVIFAPAVPKPMVQSVLEKVDVVYFAVHNSPLMRFGQSLNKVIDYMLSGKPVLASFSGYASMINEAGCGTFVEAEDIDALEQEILRFVKMSKGERQTIGERGPVWIREHHTFEKLGQRYLNYLKQIARN